MAQRELLASAERTLDAHDGWAQGELHLVHRSVLELPLPADVKRLTADVSGHPLSSAFSRHRDRIKDHLGWACRTSSSGRIPAHSVHLWGEEL